MSDVLPNQEERSDEARQQHRVRGLDATQRRAQRRERVLNAALDLFAEHGCASTSVEQICKLSHVSTKSFYELYDSREMCLLSLLGSVAHKVETSVALPRHRAAVPERDAVTELIGSFVRALTDDPRLIRLVFGPSSNMPAATTQLRTARHRAADLAETIWRRYGVVDDRAARGPSPRPRPDSHKMAIGLVGGMSDLIADWLVTAGPGDADGVAALTGDLVLLYQTISDGMGNPNRPDNRPAEQLRVPPGR